MEKPTKLKYPLTVAVAVGSFIYGVHSIEGAIEAQGDRLEAKMAYELDQKTNELTDALNGSTDQASDELKDYIGSLTLKDLLDDN